MGSNLSEILNNVSNTIRERAKLHREVEVLTTQQRLSANIIALIPVGIAVAFIIFHPTLGPILFKTTAGHISLAIGIAFELFGIWLIRRLSVIEV